MFNPSRLTLARKRRGLTKIALSRASGLALSSISLYERGSVCPSDDAVASLSAALRFPVAFFHRAEIEEPSIAGASFRALASMTAGQRDMALAAGALAIELSHWMCDRFHLPSANIPSMRGFDPETAAHALRAHWGIGERPVRNMVHLLEAHGARVFSLPPDSESVNAFSVWHRDTPYVFLTTDKSGERGRFDAAHELGHLAMHRLGGPRSREAEIEADKFASAFLMPRASVVAVAPHTPSLTTLIQLKKRWRVSVSALAYRLHAVGMLTEWHYRTLCIEISQRGFRTAEPEGIARETSQILAKVLGALRKDHISKSAIARELSLETEDLEALVFGLVIAAIPGGGSGNDGSRRASLRIVGLT